MRIRVVGRTYAWGNSYFDFLDYTYFKIFLNFPRLLVSFSSLAELYENLDLGGGVSLRSTNYTLHTDHAYCLSYRFLNNVVITTVIEMVEMVEILDGRLGQRSVERVRYVINNNYLLHLL